MRSLNSAKNLISSLSITLIMTLLGFLTRKVFVDNVGVEYLGLNGLLQNILGVVTLIEGGFGTSVVYNLYKPLAEKNQEKIIALLQLYKKVYRYIALGIVAFSICLFPFIDLFIKDAKNLSYVSIVYFIFVFNSVIQYFTAYKWSLINADQKNYKLTSINLIYQVGLSITKLLILYYTKNYILYLTIEALFNLGLNIAIVKKANQLYPYICTSKKYIVETNIKANIISNVKSLFFHSLGGYFMNSTANIVISSFVGITIVGLYSNYTLLTGYVNSLSKQILNSVSESVGNLIAEENKEKSYQVFKIIFFINFLVISYSCILLLTIIPHFISWWLGKEYILSNTTLILIIINFYIDGMRTSALIFKVKSGIFKQDRFSPLLQGIINLILSLILVQYWGINGVLFSYGFSILCIGFWQFPRLVYKYSFNKPLFLYFKQYFYYTITAIGSFLIIKIILEFVMINNSFFKALSNGVISFLIISLIYFISFHRQQVFISLISYVKNVKKNIRLS